MGEPRIAQRRFVFLGSMPPRSPVIRALAMAPCCRARRRGCAPSCFSADARSRRDRAAQPGAGGQRRENGAPGHRQNPPRRWTGRTAPRPKSLSPGSLGAGGGMQPRGEAEPVAGMKILTRRETRTRTRRGTGQARRSAPDPAPARMIRTRAAPGSRTRAVRCVITGARQHRRRRRCISRSLADAEAQQQRRQQRQRPARTAHDGDDQPQPAPAASAAQPQSGSGSNGSAK